MRSTLITKFKTSEGTFKFPIHRLNNIDYNALDREETDTLSYLGKLTHIVPFLKRKMELAKMESEGIKNSVIFQLCTSQDTEYYQSSFKLMSRNLAESYSINDPSYIDAHKAFIDLQKKYEESVAITRFLENRLFTIKSLKK